VVENKEKPSWHVGFHTHTIQPLQPLFHPTWHSSAMGAISSQFHEVNLVLSFAEILVQC
jgi:hypothetical protein